MLLCESVWALVHLCEADREVGGLEVLVDFFSDLIEVEHGWAEARTEPAGFGENLPLIVCEKLLPVGLIAPGAIPVWLLEKLRAAERLALFIVFRSIEQAATQDCEALLWLPVKSLELLDGGRVLAKLELVCLQVSEL